MESKEMINTIQYIGGMEGDHEGQGGAFRGTGGDCWSWVGGFFFKLYVYVVLYVWYFLIKFKLKNGKRSWWR